ELLGKPRSPQDARKMLATLAGRTHRVVTSVVAIRLRDQAQAIATESTRVRFAHLSANEIAEYVKSGEPLDKAGAYGIQGICGRSRILLRISAVIAPHAFFEAADAFAHSAHNFGNAPAAKQNHNDRQNDQPMNRAKLTHS